MVEARGAFLLVTGGDRRLRREGPESGPLRAADPEVKSWGARRTGPGLVSLRPP